MTAGSQRLLTARDWSVNLGRALDFVSILALAGTAEVNPAYFAAVGVLAIISYFRSIRLPSWCQLALFVMLVTHAISSWLFFKTHPVVAAAQAAPIAHAFIWFSAEGPRSRGWRIGMGFVELILASALTTEFYLPLAIVIFVVFGSVALSCNFLHAELTERAIEHSQSPLPASYIQKSIGLAMLIFLTSAIIFPMLPRTRSTMGFQGSTTSVGYTEEVALGDFTRLSGNNEGSTVLRLYTQNGSDITRDLYLGLIRGKLLGEFDGERWTPIAGVRRQPGNARAPDKSDRTIEVDVVREPIGSVILPTPYGTQGAWIESEAGLTRARQQLGNQWLEPDSEAKRVHYRFELETRTMGLGRGPDDSDPPLEAHRTVPASLENTRMKRLVSTIFAGARTDRERIMKVAAFYQREKFSASVDGDDEATRKILKSNGLTPLENFLFVRKAGHCELFASAAAVLLRMSGVPTRLVAGFRISKGAVGGVLSVRSGDAHAWLEAWTPEQGWVPMDPTPRQVAPPSFLEFARTGYDYLSAYWYRYFVTYSTETSTTLATSVLQSATSSAKLTAWEEWFRKNVTENKTRIIWTLGSILVVCLLVFAALRTWFPWMFSIRWRVREGSPALRHERLRMEKILGVDIDSPEAFLRSKFGEKPFEGIASWKDVYCEARFGRAPSNPALQLQQLKRLSNEVRGSLQSRSKAA